MKMHLSVAIATTALVTACITAVIFVFLSSCGAHNSQYVYKLYPGPELTDSDVATLKFGNGVYTVEVDGLKISSSDYGSVKLKPGDHHIRWEATFLVSVMVNASGLDRSETENVTNLVAGHTYTIQADRTTGYGYRMYLWIEDADTGEVVAGTKIQ